MFPYLPLKSCSDWGVWQLSKYPISVSFNSKKPSVHKMVKHTLKILQHLLEDFQFVFERLDKENCNIGRYRTGIYSFNVNNGNTQRMCEICSKLTIKTPEQRHWRPSGVFLINSEQISNNIMVFLLLTLNQNMLAGNNEISHGTHIVKTLLLFNITKYLPSYN